MWPIRLPVAFLGGTARMSNGPPALARNLNGSGDHRSHRNSFGSRGMRQAEPFQCPLFGVLEWFAETSPNCGWINLHMGTPGQFKQWFDSQNAKARAGGV